MAAADFEALAAPSWATRPRPRTIQYNRRHADGAIAVSDQRLRSRLSIIILEADTPAGKAFDVTLLCAIALSVIAVMLESVNSFALRFGEELRLVEWIFTVLFTIEYGLRLYCVERPSRYAHSFFGIVDLLAILPSYLSLVVPGSQSLLVIRALRLLRIFRIFKLERFLSEANVLLTALRAGSRKVAVFLGTVLVLVAILGSAMYIIEGEEHGFDNIPLSMYWAVVTMTTVGYGDLTPQTPLGRLLSTVVMVIGYSIIAIPTGIVTSEIIQAGRKPVTTRHCPHCLTEGHEMNARYCKDCAEELPRPA
jgi:voltage-gated potassium channel